MGTHPIFESDFDCLTVRMEFKQELEDLMSEHECLSINLVSSELNLHINKAKSILTKYAESKKYVRFYYLSGLVENKLKILITKDRDTEVEKFKKLYSSHIYAVTSKDFEFENYVHTLVPACHGVRKTTGQPGEERKATVKQPKTQIKDTSRDIFKKKEAPK